MSSSTQSSDTNITTNAASPKGEDATSTGSPIPDSTTAPQNTDGALSNGTYPPLGNDVMPIGAWVAPPKANALGTGNPNFITDAQYQMVAESGINMIYSLYESVQNDMPSVLQTLDLCQKYGLKYLLIDSDVAEPDEDYMRQALSRYAGHPAFAGVRVADEPGMVSFDQFSQANQIFKKLLPDKYYYINLLPSYATPNQFYYGAGGGNGKQTTNFTAYLNAYISKVMPTFVSYDYYPLIGSFPNIQDGYYNELSTFRALTAKANVPFWVFIQASAWGSGSRVPTEAEILWQVNTALAYGAKGIQYFCYFTPVESQGYGGNFIDSNGNKTAVYSYGQKANRQIAAIDQVLMNSTNQGVIVTGDSPAVVPSGDTVGSYGMLDSVSAQGAPFITGCYSYNGKDAFYVVNNSITDSGVATLHFKGQVSGSKCVDAEESNYSGSELQINLAPGEGCLVTID